MHDHLLRLIGRIDGFRDLLSSALQANLTQATVRQSEDMRKISAWVAILAVPTGVAAIYGMNFTDIPAPQWQPRISGRPASDRMHLRHLVLALSALGLALAACGGGDDAAPDVPDTIKLTSPAFADSATIPTRFTCAGDEISPPLRWRGVPDAARELALVVDDPDAPGGTFVHWVLFKLAPDRRGLADGEVPAEARQGENSTGHRAYAGPCPPPRDDPHHYDFTLYALRSPLTEKDGASADAIRTAVSDAAIARGEIVGRFGR